MRDRYFITLHTNEGSGSDTGQGVPWVYLQMEINPGHRVLLWGNGKLQWKFWVLEAADEFAMTHPFVPKVFESAAGVWAILLQAAAVPKAALSCQPA